MSILDALLYKSFGPVFIKEKVMPNPLLKK